MSKNKGNKTVVLDTSFLITCFDKSRKHSSTALQYLKYFIKNNIRMYIPAIVVSEYQCKGDIRPILETDNFIILNFNYADSIESGKFAKCLSLGGRQEQDDRVSAKDDIKILAQCSINNIDYVITEDASTLTKYCRCLQQKGMLRTTALTMEKFETSIFNNGQMELFSMLSDETI